MDRTVFYQIEENDMGMDILSFLRSRGFSRHILTGMKADKQAILLNGERGYGHSLLKAGDQLQVRILETESSPKITPVKMPLSILYEDEDLLLVNKPADMPIHPSLGNYENTLANGVAYYFAQKSEPFVYRCVNRLDRDTTGALILAKNALSAAVLSRQMRSRQIRRTYLALVEGISPEKGTIFAPIARAAGSTIEREVNFTSGETAVTHFKRLALGNGCSLIELHLETGRTHQIRVHMNYLGCPLPGDYLYHPVYDRIRRQPLHSYQLEFTHPLTEKHMCFTAPVPDDFQRAFVYPKQPDYRVCPLHSQ